MVSTKVFQTFLLLLSLALFSAEEIPSTFSGWSYENPEDWGSVSPACDGDRQSPINIELSEAVVAPIPPLVLSNYDVALSGPLVLTNNGHSADLALPATQNGERASISGALLNGTFEAIGLHFHWGSPGVRGSEHTINGKHSDVELHIVHKNSLYETVAEATEHGDGLAVLGVLLKIVNAPLSSSGLSKIVEQLPEVINYGSSATLSGELKLDELLANLDTKRFLTYEGSLTTPGCAESVIWHVFPQPLPIANDDAANFFNILDDSDAPLVNNFRPVQPINGRQIILRSRIPLPSFRSG